MIKHFSIDRVYICNSPSWLRVYRTRRGYWKFVKLRPATWPHVTSRKTRLKPILKDSAQPPKTR